MKKVLIFLLLFVFACEEMPTVNRKALPERFVIYGILSPEYSEQGVYVGTYAIYEQPKDYTDAQVSIYEGDKEWVLNPSEPGYYKTDSQTFLPQPLHTYSLKVTTQNGQTFQASTTIPGDFEVIWPQDKDTLQACYELDTTSFLHIDTTFVFSDLNGAGSYATWTLPPHYKSYRQSYHPQTVHFFAFFFNFGENYILPEHMQINVAALDTALSKWANGRNFLNSGMTGFDDTHWSPFPNARGVFGSMRLKKHTIHIRCP